MTEFEQWLALPVKKLDYQAQHAAEQRQTQLTKPAGSLGKLESIAIQLAAMQASEQPNADKVQISVFAADHGIAAEGISAFPQTVTAEMIRNFAHGGAAISVLAKEIGAKLEVINLGTISEIEPLTRVTDARIAAGTENFFHQAAMSAEQCQQAMLIGRDNVEQASNNNIALYIAGEMGIGNTTSATALASTALELDAELLVGPGTGLNKAGVSHKTKIINQAINKHRLQMKTPLDMLRFLGGFEIAALTGAYLHCAKLGLPVIIDGFIATVAALFARQIQVEASQWFIYSHNSKEPGHRIVMEALHAEPLLDMNMRLGEASGAASIVPLIRIACALHNQMATFEQAAVSDKS